MLNHVEQFEVLDNQGHKTGKIKDRGLMLLPGEYMGVVTIIVVNNKGEVLVTKRHPNKAPGLMWEVTGGGILAYEKISRQRVIGFQHLFIGTGKA